MANTQTLVLQAGAATLKEALSSLGISVSEQAFFWLLGQAYAESGLGVSGMDFFKRAKPNFEGTNNWGAVYCGAAGPKGSVKAAVQDAFCKPGAGGDATPGGARFTPSVTNYTSQFKGALGFVSFLAAIPGIKSVLQSSSSTSNDMARTLYKAGYFGGFFCGLDGAKSLNGGQVFKSACDAAALNPQKMKFAMSTQAEADEKNIAAYAAMIDNGANMARKAVGSPPVPQPIEIPVSQETKNVAKTVAKGVIGVGIVAGLWGMLTRTPKTEYKKPAKARK